MRLIVPPPLQAGVCAGGMWLVAKYVPEFAVDFQWSTYFTAFLVFIGVCIDFAALAVFFRSKTTVSPIAPQKTSRLVVSGVYKFSRNPMYLGLAFILSGFGFWLENLATFLFIPVFIWYVTRYQIIPEEEILLEKFGLEYADYVSKVRRWI